MIHRPIEYSIMDSSDSSSSTVTSIESPSSSIEHHRQPTLMYRPIFLPIREMFNLVLHIQPNQDATLICFNSSSVGPYNADFDGDEMNTITIGTNNTVDLPKANAPSIMNEYSHGTYGESRHLQHIQQPRPHT